jgi:hypothetical protein
MDDLLKLDRAVIRWLGRRLNILQRGTDLPVQRLVFLGAAALYVLVWSALCAFEHQPEWMWYLVGAGFGAIAGFFLDNEPIVPLDDGVALTHFGLESRWALMRLTYLPITLLLLVPLLADGRYPNAFTALLLLEITLFGLLEYLMTFRLVDDEWQAAASGGLFQILAAQAAGQQGDVDAGGQAEPDAEPEPEPAEPE